MSDTHSMTLGGWIDYVIEYNSIYEKQNENNNSSNGGTRMATQADFDNF